MIPMNHVNTKDKTMKKGRTSSIPAAILILAFGAASLQADTFFSRFCDTSCAPCEPVCESACDPCEPIGGSCTPRNAHPRDCDPCTLFKRNLGCGKKRSLWDSIEFDGWIQGGVYVNSRGTTMTRTEGPNYKGRRVSSLDPNSGNGNLLSSVHLTDPQVNQIWLNARRVADGSRGLDWGFAAEVFFGPEAWFAQSWSDAKFDYGWQDGDYYTAIPQLYFQLAYGDWSMKVGKYETLLGYEALRAPDFFFYSHSHMFMMEPLSHSGVLFEYTPNDRFYAALGYTTGGDASFENKYDDHGFLGKVSYQFTPQLNASYAIHYSRYGNGRVYPSGDLRWLGGNDTCLHTVTLTYDFTKKLQYAMQWNLGDAKDRITKNHRVMYGVSNYLTYQFNKRWGLGFRAEWAKDDFDADYGGGWVGYYDGEVQGYTLCLNWKPHENFSVRPEIRYDRCRQRIFNYGRNKDQFSGGVCAVISF